MRPLLAAVAALVFALAPSAQTRSALDLATSRIVTIAGGDLGSGRIVASFRLTPAQQAAVRSHPGASGTVEQSSANHVVAARGFSLRGTRMRDGVADCTQPTTACYILPEDPEALVFVVNRGTRGGR